MGSEDKVVGRISFRCCSLWALAGGLMLAGWLAGVATSIAATGTTNDRTVSGAPVWTSLYGVAVRPDGSAYVVGSKGLLLVSGDNGKSWDLQTLHERPGNVLFQDRDLYAIRFTPDGQSGWIVGEQGFILHSADGGKSWTPQQSGITTNLFNLAAIDAQHAYACGEDGMLLSTSDGGQTWKAYKHKDLITFFDIVYTDANNGWAVGEFETILHTTDGGRTWSLSHGGNSTDFTVGPYFSIVFTDPAHALVTGLNGDVIGTADGGKSWTAQKLPEAFATYTAAQSGGRMWLGGEGGRLVRTEAGGKWTVQRPTFNDITSVAFLGNAGYAVGLNGTILRTDSAGGQWQVVK